MSKESRFAPDSDFVSDSDCNSCLFSDSDSVRVNREDGRANPKLLMSREVGRAVKQLQKNLQATFTNTRNLPKDLFLAFCKCDEDMSGQIDYDEFKQVVQCSARFTV